MCRSEPIAAPFCSAKAFHANLCAVLRNRRAQGTESRREYPNNGRSGGMADLASSWLLGGATDVGSGTEQPPARGGAHCRPRRHERGGLHKRAGGPRLCGTEDGGYTAACQPRAHSSWALQATRANLPRRGAAGQTRLNPPQLPTVGAVSRQEKNARLQQKMGRCSQKMATNRVTRQGGRPRKAQAAWAGAWGTR
jgi:hypothetical protein